MPELMCDRCGEDYPVWFAPDDLWNRTVHLEDDTPFLCPRCFTVLAAKLGVCDYFEVRPAPLSNYTTQPKEPKMLVEHPNVLTMQNCLLWVSSENPAPAITVEKGAVRIKNRAIVPLSEWQRREKCWEWFGWLFKVLRMSDGR